MRKKARNPEEYVFYEGIENIQFESVNFADDEIEQKNKFYKDDGLNYYIDNNYLDEDSNQNDREQLMQNLQTFFNDSTRQFQNDNFKDLIHHKNVVLTSEEEYLQRNFRDFLELKYETRLPRSFSSSAIIPLESLKKSNEKIEIHDDPSKHTGKNKHRSTVLIKKDENAVVKGIQVICICGERINISFDYNEEESINTQSEYEAQSPQE